MHYKIGQSSSVHLKKAKGLVKVFYVHSDFTWKGLRGKHFLGLDFWLEHALAKPDQASQWQYNWPLNGIVPVAPKYKPVRNH